MAAIVEHPVIIPATSEVYQQEQQPLQPDGEPTETDIEKQNKNAPVAPEELATLIEKLKQDPFLETPSTAAPPQSPPPPYSQWDELNLENLEQLLQKSREVLNGHSEFLAQSGNQKEINADMVEKMTQLESLVSSLQAKLSDQTFAMHDLKSQLSDVQNVLKNMQDSKQETMDREEVMKQVIAMKQLYENIIASSEASNATTESIAQDETIEEESQEEPQLPTEEIIPSFIPSSPPDSSLSVILMPPSRPVSRTTSRQTSRAPSRSGSRSASRTVSPVRSPALSRSSSKIKLDVPPPVPVSPSMRPFKGPTMGPINEDGGDNDDNDDENDDENDDDDGDEGDESNDEDTVAFERMSSMLLTLITEATTAVEAPVKGREKKVRQSSNASTVSRDYFEDFDWDALADEEESVADQTEVVEKEKKVEIVKERRREKRDHHHKRSKSKKEEEFEESFKSLDSSLTQVQCLITDMTDEFMEEEEAVIKRDSNGMLIREIKDKNGVVIREEPVMPYQDPTQELINNPSADWADLDDFAQQCRLLTRALILPFLHATHSFMSESLRTTSQENSPRSVTGTTRTFLNLIYWTFLFTLGSLVLDAWLCEVAGRQVIRMVDMLKPGQPFGLVQNPQPVYEIENDRQNYGYDREYGVRMVDDGKKKNVKIRTGFRLKGVSWRGVEASVGSGRRWLRNGARGVMSLGRRGGHFLTGGRWGFNKSYQNSMLSRQWEEGDMSEDSEEWEIVDFDSSDDDDESVLGESSEEDPALALKRRITDERLKRAGHVKPILNNNDDARKEEAGKINVQEIDLSSSNERCVDIKDDETCEVQRQQPLEIVSKRTIKIVEEDGHDDTDQDNEKNGNDKDEQEDPDEIDLPIPGSFPAAFKWNPSFESTTIESEESEIETIKRVRSVVLRRPKRDGPFGGSGGFWVMQTRKVRTKSSKKSETKLHSNQNRASIGKKECDSADLLKSSNAKSSPISKKKKKSNSSKRAWVRRNSI